MSTTIQLDRTRTLHYDINALRKLKREAGINILEVENDDSFMAIVTDPDNIAAFVWAGLIKDDSTLSIDDVGALLDLGNLAEVTRKCMGAFGQSVEGELTADPPAVATG